MVAFKTLTYYSRYPIPEKNSLSRGYKAALTQQKLHEKFPEYFPRIHAALEYDGRTFAIISELARGVSLKKYLESFPLVDRERLKNKIKVDLDKIFNRIAEEGRFLEKDDYDYVSGAVNEENIFIDVNSKEKRKYTIVDTDSLVPESEL